MVNKLGWVPRSKTYILVRMRGAGNKPTTNIINAGAGRDKVGVEGALWRGDVWSENFKKGHGNVCV